MTFSADRYEILEELGSGGMATVYRARDRALNRDVALKILNPELASNPTLIARFLREAKVIASLDHPSVLKLFDVVEAQPSPFLVTELLHGQTLDQKLKDRSWPLRDRITILEQIARAVHHAHQHGIVHRDLKPQNVMIEDSGRVVVMDFGLAHIANSESRLTRSGASMGTPYYMAPEQVHTHPKEITPRTDVYALGTILYELLTGHPPFLGSLAEVYHKVLVQDPVPPRQISPRVAADLETVCLKAIAKDPRDRYATAEMFADDLARHQAGQSIAAKPASSWSRIARQVSRRRGAAIVVASIIALSMGSFLLWLTLRSKESQVFSAQQALLDEMRSTAKTCLESALDLRHAGNLEAMNRQAARLESICHEVIAQRPALAKPHYHLGRLYRAQMKDREALAEQEAALLKDPQDAQARYERIVLRAKECRRRWLDFLRERRAREAQRFVLGGARPGTREREKDPDSLDEIAKLDAGLSQSLRLLQADLAALEAHLSRIGQGEAFCARGLNAWMMRDYGGAHEFLEEALARNPTLEEAYESLAALPERTHPEESIRWWTRGLEQDRGYVPHWIGRGIDRTRLGDLCRAQGLDPSEHYQGAVADFDEAIRLEPGSERAWRQRGAARVNWAIDIRNRGGNPVELLTAAIGDFEEDLRHDPGSAFTRFYRGNARSTLANSCPDENQVRKLSREAIEDYSEALRINPRQMEAWGARGTVRMNLASRKLAEAEGGVQPAYLAAIEDFTQALGLDPEWDQVWARRGAARTYLGLQMTVQGADPGTLFVDAISDLSEAIRINPENSDAWIERGYVHMHIGLKAKRNGEDPQEHYQKGLSDLSQAVRINPAQYDGWVRLGSARTELAAYLMDREGDPAPFLETAIEDLTRAIHIDAGRAGAWVQRGHAHYHLAGVKVRRRGKAAPQYKAALDDYAQAIRLEPSLEAVVSQRMGACDEFLHAHPDQ